MLGCCRSFFLFRFVWPAPYFIFMNEMRRWKKKMEEEEEEEVEARVSFIDKRRPRSVIISITMMVVMVIEIGPSFDVVDVVFFSLFFFLLASFFFFVVVVVVVVFARRLAREIQWVNADDDDDDDDDPNAAHAEEETTTSTTPKRPRREFSVRNLGVGRLTLCFPRR